MKISHRLYLTVTPAIVGVFLMAALAYWGEYARRAPGIVLVGGTIAVVASLLLTWSSARYVSRRIERIAAGRIDAGEPRPPNDEIDEIERAVNRLSHAVELAEATRADGERVFEQRAQDYARLLAAAATSAARRLDEVRIPLHILLDNHFGDLNENQEEMLGAARAAAEAADADMGYLQQIAELDLGTRELRRDRIKPSELVDAMRPTLLAAAEAASSTIEFDVAPLLPAVVADRARLQDALVTLVRSAIESAPRDSRVSMHVDRSAATIMFVVAGAGDAPATVQWAAASRVVQAHGGTVERSSRGVALSLPVATPELALPGAHQR